jgi:hypothetical protein
MATETRVKCKRQSSASPRGKNPAEQDTDYRHGEDAEILKHLVF